MSYWPIAFLLPAAASSRDPPHMLYHLKPGGVSVRSQSLIVTCSYTEEKRSLMEIIQSSFQTFLLKELQDVAKWRCKRV